MADRDPKPDIRALAEAARLSASAIVAGIHPDGLEIDAETRDSAAGILALAEYALAVEEALQRIAEVVDDDCAGEDRDLALWQIKEILDGK